MQKTFKIHYVSSAGPDLALKRLYYRLPELETLSYQQQHGEIVAQRFDHSDYLPRALRSLGHEVTQFFCDAEILQKTWGRENQVAYVPRMWRTALVVAQILAQKPEIVYFQDFCQLPGQFLTNLRRLCPSIKLLVVHQDRRANFKELKEIDLCLVTSPGLQKLAAKSGIAAHVVYYGFDPLILKELEESFGSDKPDENSLKFSFAGTSGFNDPDSYARYWTLASMIRQNHLFVWANERMDEKARRLSAYRRFVSDWLERAGNDDLEYLVTIRDFVTRDNEKIAIGELLVAQAEAKLFSVQATDRATLLTERPPLALRELFPGRTQEPLFGLPLMDHYRCVQINLNVHPSVGDGIFGNPRMFDVTGVGSCLLTDAACNLAELFGADEVVTYSSVQEAKEKVDYLQEHPEYRAAVAQAGQKKTLQSHTWNHRADQIHDLLNHAIHGGLNTTIAVEITKQPEVKPPDALTVPASLPVFNQK